MTDTAATSTEVDADQGSGHSAGHDDEAHAHPTEGTYWIVFVALVVLTAVEVAWSFLGFEGPALVLPLIAMMTVKFLLVAGAFMHLYFDLRIINGKLFTWAFASGLALAATVYLVVVAAFRFKV
jgi:heme/copper-type cytochrome/quinol oxidase subunit 4